jgi:hypothetical protein
MRTDLLPLLFLLSTGACAAQVSPTASDVPPIPGPGPMRAEADQVKATIEQAARACAEGRLSDVTAVLEPYLKVSRPLEPDLGEPELLPRVNQLCGGAPVGSIAELDAMVEEIAIQPNAALTTVTLVGRIRGAPNGGHFIVRGLVHLQRGGTVWRVSRAAYWPHEIPPVS